MTTKLTEAEVKALPVCKLCGKPPRTSVLSEHIRCECVGWFYTPDQWRLLMTPEAKGKWHDLDDPCASCRSVHESIVRTHAVLDATNIQGDVSTHTGLTDRIKLLIAERDSLQSKLAKYEELVCKLDGKLKDAEKTEDVLRREYNETMNVVNEVWKLVRPNSNTLTLTVTDAVRFIKQNHESAKVRIAELEKQLAEATKPVGELENEIKIVDAWIHNQEFDQKARTKLKDCFASIIRAVRQRKPSGDVVNALNRVRQTAKSYLRVEASSKANAVQRMSYRNDLHVAINIADSILAQAKSAAEDSVAKEIITASTEGVARVPAADLIVDQPYHIDPTPQIGLGDGDYFINFDAKRILNDTDHHEPEIRWTTPEEMKDVERRRKSPKVIFSGIDATQYDFHKAEQAVRAILGDFQLVLESFTFLPRKEHEPHADAYDSVPAADLLTAEERKFLEALRHIFTEGDKDKSDINAFTIIDRLAPAPSAATLTGEKP